MTGPRYINPSTRHNGGQVIVVPQGGGSTQVVTPEEPVEVPLNIQQATSTSQTVISDSTHQYVNGTYILIQPAEVDRLVAVSGTLGVRWTAGTYAVGRIKYRSPAAGDWLDAPDPERQDCVESMTSSSLYASGRVSALIPVAAGDSMDLRLYAWSNSGGSFNAEAARCSLRAEVWPLTLTQGPQGIQGPQGSPGPTGATGPVGPQGPIGPAQNEVRIQADPPPTDGSVDLWIDSDQDVEVLIEGDVEEFLPFTPNGWTVVPTSSPIQPEANVRVTENFDDDGVPSLRIQWDEFVWNSPAGYTLLLVKSVPALPDPVADQWVDSTFTFTGRNALPPGATGIYPWPQASAGMGKYTHPSGGYGIENMAWPRGQLTWSQAGQLWTWTGTVIARAVTVANYNSNGVMISVNMLGGFPSSGTTVVAGDIRIHGMTFTRRKAFPAKPMYWLDGTVWRPVAAGVGVPEAPMDGQRYVRQNGQWVVV